MSKVSGTYPSLSRGVNQQPFEARLDGQHGEQINMWSDPVQGLTRRRGTILQQSEADNVNGPSYHQFTEAQQKEARDFYASYRTIPYTTEGLELQVHYPSKPMPTWMRPSTYGPGGGIRVSLKQTGTGVLVKGAAVEPVGLGTPSGSEAIRTRAAVDGGIAAACQVGRYMLFYPSGKPFAVPAETDYWDSDANSHWAIEVKQGAPNRTYKVGYYVDGVHYLFSYTTPSSAYSGTLDTSDILVSDPEYQKKVNDRVNAYNSAVTAWITTAAAQTRPQYIVDQLLAAGLAGPLTTVGSLVNGGSAHTVANVIVVRNTNGRTRSPTILDGGDGSFVAATGDTVNSLAHLTSAHAYGKVVRIQPERGNAAFYMKAVPDDDSLEAWGQCRWEECPRTSQGQIENPMLAMAVKNPPGAVTFRTGLAVADTAGIAHLASADVLGDPTILELPKFNGRLVGDADAAPSPRFFGRQVSWMGMFQDRLCIAAGNTVDMSEVGNYFNFYRTQTLTVPDTDPVSIFALGSETDTIRHSVIFDRSLLLFGDNQQYSIDGRNPVTPSTSTIIQSSAIEDATDCPPVVGGSLVFFGKRREETAEVFQMEVGDVADTSNFTGLGLQLSDYLPGRPAQLLYVASPSTLFVRCSEAPHSVFVFRFIDTNRQRVLDSWSRFDYHPAFGIIYAMFYHEDALYYRVAREAWVDGTGHVWVGGRGDFGFDVLERQSLRTTVDNLPYLDSMRPAAAFWTGVAQGSDFWSANYPFMATAVAKQKVIGEGPPSQYWLHGVTPNVRTLTEWNTSFSALPGLSTDYGVTGLVFGGRVELTSPVRRDQNGQPIMQGRLTVGKLDVYYKDAGGFSAEVVTRYGLAAQFNNFDWVATDTAYGKVTALSFNGRVLGSATNMAGVMPVSTGRASVFVGRDSKDYVCNISSRGWMPLSITRVTWTGQWFLNHRFV